MPLLLALALYGPAEPTNLQLLCTGMGSQAKTSFRDDPSHNFNYSVAVIDDVRIDISGDTGRIQIPQPMMPPLHGGKDRWFELRDVIATQDEITASASINPLNHVKVRLNRLNGGLTLTVLKGEYRGMCQPFSDQTKRVF